MPRRAYTLLEVLLVLGMLSVIGGIAAPTYRDYRIRNDLLTAAELVSQALERAKILAQSGSRDAPWGFDVTHQTLFAGPSYAGRIAGQDERYVLPGAVATSGLESVTFAPLTGEPSATGSIILTSLRGERATVAVVIDRQGIALSIDDRLTICHCEASPPHTLKIPEAAWPAHRGHGDHLGACAAPDPWQGCSSQKK